MILSMVSHKVITSEYLKTLPCLPLRWAQIGIVVRVSLSKRVWADVCVCMCVQGYERMRSSCKTSMGGKGRVRDTDGLCLQNEGKSYSKKIGLTRLQSHSTTA